MASGTGIKELQVGLVLGEAPLSPGGRAWLGASTQVEGKAKEGAAGKERAERGPLGQGSRKTELQAKQAPAWATRPFLCPEHPAAVQRGDWQNTGMHRCASLLQQHRSKVSGPSAPKPLSSPQSHQ